MQIHSLELKTAQLEGCFEFYTQVLELPVLEQTETSFTVQIGTSKLTFMPAVVGETPVYHFAFNIPENQLLEAKAWVEARVPLISDPQGEVLFDSENWNASMFYFYDPAGNILELIARHDLGNASDKSFSWQSLENISEIGIATENVPATVGRLQALTKAPLYRCEINDSFVPLGDEAGLLIVVKRGRIWFPNTGKSAEFVPLRVSLESGQTLSQSEV